jgi:hypothetical protein
MIFHGISPVIVFAALSAFVYISCVTTVDPLLAVPADRCFTIKTLAYRWRKRPSEIRRMVRDGELRAFTFGDSRIRIAPEVVREFEEQHQVAQPKWKRRRPRRPQGWIERF